jgi:hypothetical protein
MSKTENRIEALWNEYRLSVRAVSPQEFIDRLVLLARDYKSIACISRDSLVVFLTFDGCETCFKMPDSNQARGLIRSMCARFVRLASSHSSAEFDQQREVFESKFKDPEGMVFELTVKDLDGVDLKVRIFFVNTLSSYHFRIERLEL